VDNPIQPPINERIPPESRVQKKFADIVRERRATSLFSAALVRDEDLYTILRAGLEAPSSYNMQPWRFVVVRDAEQK